MDFTRRDWETILARVGGAEHLVASLRQWHDEMQAASELDKTEPWLAGVLVEPKEIAALIERIEREGRR